MEKLRIYNQAELALFHSKSLGNFDLFMTLNNKCGCFSCEHMFKAKDIKETIPELNNRRTILCPKCEIDAVIVENLDFVLTKSLLKQMYNKYFKTTYEGINDALLHDG